ncbi:hypothetical protein VNO80_15750 [Phaseolus coccineus]|uniref:Uncharacterized protein n=1 Tax=Phaseolus coccineus TaxID=3886 RepID=A0AAN9R234_PHACN
MIATSTTNSTLKSIPSHARSETSSTPYEWFTMSSIRSLGTNDALYIELDALYIELDPNMVHKSDTTPTPNPEHLHSKTPKTLWKQRQG